MEGRACCPEMSTNSRWQRKKGCKGLFWPTSRDIQALGSWMAQLIPRAWQPC